MPRRKVIAKREVLPDSKYGSALVAKFINCVMGDGKKSTAERIVYGALDAIENKTHQEPLAVFKQAVNNVKPVLEVKSRRVGGATYREAHLIMEMLHDSGLMSSLDIVELNPFLDDRGKSALLLVDLVTSLFGRRIIDRPSPRLSELPDIPEQTAPVFMDEARP